MNRRVISAVAPAVLLVLASGYQLDAQVRQEMAQGYVFEDQNGTDSVMRESQASPVSVSPMAARWS